MALRRFAYQRSPFYRRFHRGLEHQPLSQLPVLSKAELMRSFDDVLTDRSVRLADVNAFLAGLAGYERYRGCYWVAKTSGSTGHQGVFLADGREWATIISSYSRAQEWAGIRATLTSRTRLAVVSSRVPWHQSALVGLSVDSPIIPVRRFDAVSPLEQIVSGLNRWRPENLVCYASMARVLADEQLAGRLRITPRAVMCSSEVLTEETRRRIMQAFGVTPFNVYAATETAGIAADCELHRMHLFEDLVIPEVVDENNLPVPPGVVGARILVTVLFSRTQPLIRYEMSDTLSLSPERCLCGRAFGLVGSVDGRAEDVLLLRRPTGAEVAIHPNVFHRALEAPAIREWQVVQQADSLLARIVAGPDASDEAIATAIRRELENAGASPPPIRIERADALARTSIGKAPLVRAFRGQEPVIPP
jgi:phenylacetate-CoA ligase